MISSFAAISLAIEINELVESCGYPLEDLVSEVDAAQASGLPPAGEEVAAAAALVEAFRQMATAAGGQDTESLSPGQMLFVAFNSLFDKVEAAVKDLASAMKTYGSGFEATVVGTGGLHDIASVLARVTVFRNYFASCTKCMLCFKVDPTVLGQFFPTGETSLCGSTTTCLSPIIETLHIST